MAKEQPKLIYEDCFKERKYFETEEISSLNKLNKGKTYSAEVYCQGRGKPYFTMREVKKSLLVNLLKIVLTEEVHGKKRAHIERVK
ncbi:hypothetical protein GF378_01450 [Candidatus Pacearchaeota archaeon]|nr:hypothetical protein [Candidatus Pacearchaeota archaeon]